MITCPQQILSSRKQTIAQHFSNAEKYNQHASVQKKVCQLLVEQIASRHQTSVLEIGAGSGQLTQLLLNHITADEWHINELTSSQANKLAQLLSSVNNAKLHIGDAETMKFTHLSNSLIISANAVQWFDNPLCFINQSRQRLANNGQLVFNTFTPNNFKQIKQLTGQGLNYPSIAQWKNEIKKSGLTINEVSTHQFDLTFDTPYQILQHIKQTGVSCVNLDKKAPFIWTKSKLQTFYKDYQQAFMNTEGKLILSYDVLLVNLQKD